MNKALLLLCKVAVFFSISIVPFHSFAYKFFEDNDEFFLKYLKQEKFAIDTSASAIVLYEYHSYDLHSSLYLKHQVRRIIKIIKKSGLEYADISIPFPVSRFSYYHVGKVHGTTYNLDGEKLVKQEINEDNIALENASNLKEKKISMPSVHEGSIIDYSYEIEEENFPISIAKWEVQEDIPKLYSKTELFISKTIGFSTDDIIYRFKELEENKKNTIDSLLPRAYTYREIEDDLLKQYWVRRNIPAFQDEPYLPCESNYRESMHIWASSIQGLFEVGLFNSWYKINDALLDDLHFYRAITAWSATVKEKATQLAGIDTSELKIANKIYKFVRDSITASGYSSMFTKKALSKVLEDRSGNSAEINLLLIALMRHAGLSCSPAMLSTKDNATPGADPPEIIRYDYTICQLRINNQKYYLDAAEKYNPFGRIPPNCLNGYVRVIEKGKKDTSGIIFKPEMAKEKALYAVTTTSNALNDYTLNFKLYYGDEASINKRTEWNKDTAEIKNYIRSFIKDLPFDTKIIQYKVLNLNDPEKQLTLDFSISMAWPSDGSVVYFNPYAIKFFENAPFKNPKRKYPVELPATQNLTYTLNLKLPDGYTVDEVPKSGIIKIDETNQYKNMVAYTKETNTLDVYSRLQMPRIYYPLNEYSMLKEFFEKMSEEQQKTLVIKKQN